MNAHPKAIAFDIIETLFSLEPLRADFEQVGLPGSSLELWFATGLRDTFAMAASRSYAPFRTVLEGALEEICAGEGKRIAAEDQDRLFDMMGSLPPHPDVGPGLDRLRRTDVKMIALSNGSAKMTTGLLERARFGFAFDKVVSTDDVGCAKPREEVYHHAAKMAEVSPGDLMLIAAHPWDVHGAKKAGLLAAYLDRGKPFPSFLASPDLTEPSLDRLAERIERIPAGD